jgi:vancomycin aglycone glucosyltransferase
MRVLFSTIGTRGDVQPLVALALHLKTLGHEARLCVPPDFKNWIESLGLPVIPMGPELRSTAKTSSSATKPTPEQMKLMVEGTVNTQFETLIQAAEGCDIIVGATALQIAAPSVAEKMGIPYIFVAYCPAVLPSPHHAPPVLSMHGQTPASADAPYKELWKRDADIFNATFGSVLNKHRSALGLPAIEDVRTHVLTKRPWLAADSTLAPWPEAASEVFQSGAWILEDRRPLPTELETFLSAGDPPVYFGFGSMRAPEDLGQTMIQSARTLGRRAILSRGWAGLNVTDKEGDYILIDEVNQQALFKQVAAVVHHGGAGHTAAAALASAPQLVIPQHYDQHYWAQRVELLGIGTAHGSTPLTLESLTSGLQRALLPDVHKQAQAIAKAVRVDGTQVAARRLMDICKRTSC